jgi:hypothetical protein
VVGALAHVSENTKQPSSKEYREIPWLLSCLVFSAFCAASRRQPLCNIAFIALAKAQGVLFIAGRLPVHPAVLIS